MRKKQTFYKITMYQLCLHLSWLPYASTKLTVLQLQIYIELYIFRLLFAVLQLFLSLVLQQIETYPQILYHLCSWWCMKIWEIHAMPKVRQQSMNLTDFGWIKENLVLGILFMLLKLISITLVKCLKITLKQQGTHRKAIRIHIVTGFYKTRKQILSISMYLYIFLTITYSLQRLVPDDTVHKVTSCHQ